jgi:phenylacetate-CoA ligase
MSLPSSCVPGIAWPGLPTAAGAAMLALQWQLEESQWWPAQRIVAYQLKQLRALIEHAAARVPFYGRAKGGVATLDENTFRDWPILRKSDIRANEAALRATAYPAAHGGVTQTQTTGSTGMPIRVYRTQVESFFAQALVLREHLLHGRDFSRKFGAMRAYVNETTQAGWGVANQVFATGAGCAIPFHADLDQQLDWLARERPAYLLGKPSNLRALVLRSRERGIVPAGLVELICFSETLPEDLRPLARDCWNVPVTDTYSCNEAAGLAMQCPGFEHYLVHAENVYLEVLRDDGEPCGPGETGRVVITPLHNFAMPLIRYELGDYAQVGEPCPTGRGLPVLARIAGRVRNMLRDPAGRTRFPSFPPTLWMDVAPIRQARLVQRTLSSIEVQYVMDGGLSAEQGRRLVGALQERLGYPFDITLSRVAEIERQPGGKFEEFLSLLPGA